VTGLVNLRQNSPIRVSTFSLSKSGHPLNPIDRIAQGEVDDHPP
jgi:hypothetical protein